MNKKLLKQRIRTATGTSAVSDVLAELLKISKNSLSARMQGRRQWKADEIEIIRVTFNLSDAEVIEIFIKGAAK